MTKNHSSHTPDIAFYLGEWPVHTYSITMGIGILFSIIVLLYFWKRQKYSIESLEVLILIIIPVSIFCARIWYVLGNLNDGKTDWSSEWYKVWNGGLAIQGGVMGAGIASTAYIISKKHVLDLRIVASYMLPSVLIGQAIGRWGNFANHEVYGRIDPSGIWSKWMGSWIHSNMYIDGNYRVPLFFYEFMSSVLGVILMVFIFNVFNWQKPGTMAGAYFFWYGIVRIIMEPLRDSSDKMWWFNKNILASEFTSGCYIAFGLIVIIYCSFDVNINAILKSVKFQFKQKHKRNIKTKNYNKKTFKECYIDILKKTEYKYTRVEVNQHLFFIIAPLKLAVISKSFLNSIFGKGKFHIASSERDMKMNKVKGGFIMLAIKKTLIFISFVWNCLFSKILYNIKKEEVVKTFSKFKCMKWKFKSYIWIKKEKISNLKGV